MIIYGLRTFNSSMWGSLRLAPIIIIIYNIDCERATRLCGARLNYVKRMYNYIIYTSKISTDIIMLGSLMLMHIKQRIQNGACKSCEIGLTPSCIVR